MSAFSNEEEDEEFEVPDEEKLAIATHFLLSAPIGEFDDILSDVKKMLPERSTFQKPPTEMPANTTSSSTLL